jgi:hypothetical protein
MDEIYKIRRENYEETKDMSSEERSEHSRKEIEEVAKELGCLIVESPDHKGAIKFIRSNFNFKLP